MLNDAVRRNKVSLSRLSSAETESLILNSPLLPSLFRTNLSSIVNSSEIFFVLTLHSIL